MLSRKEGVRVLLAFTVLPVVTGTAAAQEVDQTIVVTASKIEAGGARQGQAFQSVTRDRLEATGVTSPDDLGRVVPGC